MQRVDAGRHAPASIVWRRYKLTNDGTKPCSSFNSCNTSHAPAHDMCPCISSYNTPSSPLAGNSMYDQYISDQNRACLPVVAEALHGSEAGVAQHPVHVCEEVRGTARQREQLAGHARGLHGRCVAPHAYHTIHHAVCVAAARRRTVAEGLRVYFAGHGCLWFTLK
eukprot:GHRQ01022826.1.p1 GENE.GHRQ01022826.1~~GHRQ01022826.1.p1  ORF type:complete len:166 (+),score=10.34 GHRQ01022826.1:6-503(+)